MNGETAVRVYKQIVIVHAARVQLRHSETWVRVAYVHYESLKKEGGMVKTWCGMDGEAD